MDDTYNIKNEMFVLKDSKNIYNVEGIIGLENNIYVSVVLPTYNREKTIEQSIRSVLGQTHKYLELIVVDDGSTDHTRQIVEKIEDERIRYIRLEKNQGPSHARNVGIQEAKYELIAFEDSDDLWREHKLAMQLDKLKENEEYDMVYCAYSYLRDGKTKKIPSDRFDINELEGDMFESLSKENKIGAPTILIRKKCFDEMGGYNETLHSLEDWELVLRMSTKYKIGYVNETLVEARFTPNSVSYNVHGRINTYLFILKEYELKAQTCKALKMHIFNELAKLNDIERMEWKNKLMPYVIESSADNEFILDIVKVHKKTKDQLNVIQCITQIGMLKKFLECNLDKEKKKIAIYGAGYVGLTLARMLTVLNYSVEYLIDCRPVVSEEFEVYVPNEVETLSDVLFVAIGDKIDKEMFQQYVCGKIINIYDICKLG